MTIIKYKFLTKDQVRILKQLGFLVEFHKTCQMGYGFRRMYAIGVK